MNPYTLRSEELDRRGDIYAKTAKEDDAGGRRASFEKAATVWGKALRPHFTDTVAEGSHSVILTQGILIRRREVEQGWRVMMDGKRYDVIHVDDSQRGETTLTCKEVSK